MKKISIKGRKDQLKPTIDALKGTRAFEITSTGRTKNNPVDETNRALHDHLTTLQARIENALDYTRKSKETYTLAAKKQKLKKSNIVEISNATGSNRRALESDEIDYSELKNIGNDENIILNLIDNIEELSAKNLEIKNRVEQNKATIKELSFYTALEVPFNKLHDTEQTFVLAGIIPYGSLEKFKSDFDLSNIVVEEYNADAVNACCVLIGHKEDLPIVSAIYDYEFERCKFNFNMNAHEKIKALQEQTAVLSEQHFTILQKSVLSLENIRTLEFYYDYISNELDTEDIIINIRQGENFFVLNGWFIDAAQDKIEIILKNLPGIQYKISEAAQSDTAPVLVKSSSIIDPYQSITNLYGAPSKNDIDPNPFVAFFYFLFFGVMIGDVGYGILLSVIGFAFVYFKRPKKGMKDLILLIAMGGISSVLWGLLYGSVFGFNVSESSILSSILPAGLVDPINNALMFLGLTLALGVLQIVFGICLKFYNLMRQGRYIDAVCDALFRVIMFLGLICFALPMIFPDISAFSSLETPGLYIAISALVLLMLTAGRKNKGILGKISGGFGALYSLVNYFSDIISYARLFGLGLVGAVIGLVANTMGGLLMDIAIIGPVLGVLIALVFHALNLALGLLSAYVHNARLQFIEFFGKFYEGNGKIFEPIGSNTKYIKLKETLK